MFGDFLEGHDEGVKFGGIAVRIKGALKEAAAKGLDGFSFEVLARLRARSVGVEIAVVGFAYKVDEEFFFVA
jgi:hypothetical protein